MSGLLDSLISAFTKKSTATPAPDPATELTPTILQDFKPMATPAPAQPVAHVSPVADKLTLKNIQTAHPKVRAELGQIYNEILIKVNGKAHCRFVYVLRTMAEQAAIYAQGRTAPGKIVTNASAGLSMHQYGCAVDIALILDGKTASWDTTTDFNGDGDGKSTWSVIVDVFKKHGWEWGGDWKTFSDLPHFQKAFGHKPSDLLALYKAGNVDSNGYVKI